MVLSTQERVNSPFVGLIAKGKPLSYARATFIDGDQGSGKSETAIAIGVNATFKGMTSVKLSDGLIVKAQPVLNKQGYAIIGYGKLWLPNQEPRIMKTPPKSCVMAEGVRIIYNGHLWGIRYLHMDLADIIRHFNKDDEILKNCFLIIDEAYIGADRRDFMSPVVKVMSKLTKQLRKRHIHLVMCTPDSTELDLRFQKIEVEHIVCSYDEDTNRITEFIRNPKKYRKLREVTYDGRLYRKYYDTDEIYPISEVQLNRAMAMAGIVNA